jgi:hypothetical protein
LPALIQQVALQLQPAFHQRALAHKSRRVSIGDSYRYPRSMNNKERTFFAMKQPTKTQNLASREERQQFRQKMKWELKSMAQESFGDQLTHINHA